MNFKYRHHSKNAGYISILSSKTLVPGMISSKYSITCLLLAPSSTLVDLINVLVRNSSAHKMQIMRHSDFYDAR
jgi:hypothetical protein